MEREEFAQKIDELMRYGNISVAFHPTKVSTGRDEQQNQAHQFAADHWSLSITDGELTMGSANGVGATPVWETLRLVSEKAAALLQEFGLLAADGVVKINDIAIFTHGGQYSLQIAAVNGSENGWIRTSLPIFAEKIATYLSDTSKIILYACHVAGNDDGIVPFAESLRLAVQSHLDTIYGIGATTLEVWGHKDKGHTSANHRLVKFAGSGNYNNGQSFLDDMAEWLCSDFFSERGQDFYSYPDESKKKRLLDSCYKMAYKAFQVYGPPGTNTDENGKAYTHPTHPVNNLIREIPYYGIETFYNDLKDTSDPYYTNLMITEDAAQRLADGMLRKRKRYTTESAALAPAFSNL